ncbi:MAG: hypothetical protein QME73_06040 [Bacillota bacterium]|nr:hypothetical protein [Bacillota bacterium]
MNTELKEICENCQYKKAAEKNKSPDLGEMLKLAMMISKMFSQNLPSRKPADEPPQQASSVQRMALPAVVNIDAFAEDKRIRIIKSALPYLEPNQQQLMHLVAKCMEIKNIVSSNLYQTRVSCKTEPGQSSLGMLNAIKPHLDSTEQYIMDIACKALEMVEVMRAMDKIKASRNQEVNSEASNKEDGN